MKLTDTCIIKKLASDLVNLTHLSNSVVIFKIRPMSPISNQVFVMSKYAGISRWCAICGQKHFHFSCNKPCAEYVVRRDVTDLTSINNPLDTIILDIPSNTKSME